MTRLRSALRAARFRLSRAWHGPDIAEVQAQRQEALREADAERRLRLVTEQCLRTAEANRRTLEACLESAEAAERAAVKERNAALDHVAELEQRIQDLRLRAALLPDARRDEEIRRLRAANSRLEDDLARYRAAEHPHVPAPKQDAGWPVARGFV